MSTRTGYDKIALQHILSDVNFRTFDNDGRLLPPSHEIYQIISKMMAEKGSVITPKHIYTIINNNRGGFRDLVMEVLGISKQELSFSRNDDSYCDEIRADQVTNSLTSLTALQLNLVISQEKWQNIKPEEKKYGQRIYWKLRQGWADVIAEALWVQHHLECVFVFKNNNVYISANAKYFLTIDGFCRECDAKIYCTLLKQPLNDVDIILKCNIDGIRLTLHSGNKKRPLRGIRRRAVADYLIDGHKDAVIWRREEAGRIKLFGGKNPPILPSNDVIRKAKEQRLLSKYGLEFGNPALNLLKSAEHGKLLGCIHYIGLYKFNCMYWRPEQLQMYVSRCRNDPNATLTIDATGGIAKRENSQNPHIFLYQCVLVTKEGSVPTFQMVSADQRSIIVAGFLSHILAANAPIPPIVVTDFGWSLLIAVAQIFGQCASLNDYLQRCYDALVNKSTSLPSTFLRLDVCHLSSMIARWPSLKGKDKFLVRRFYRRCIGKACQMTNLDDLAFFLQSVLIVALSKCIGSGADGQLLPSVERLNYLNNKIKGIGINHDDDDSEDDYNEDTEKNEDNMGNNGEEEFIHNEKDNGRAGWKAWRDKLYNEAVNVADQSSEGDTINACYNIDLAKRLKSYLLPYSPLWTAIMVPVFGRGSVTATSAAVESEFSDLKHREFRGEIPMRIDRFVIQHLERIDNKIKERSKPSDMPKHTGDGISNAQSNVRLNYLYSHAQSKYKSNDGNPITKSTDGDSGNIITTKKESIEFIKYEPVSTGQSNQPAGIFSSLNDESLRDENIPADNDWNVNEEWGGLNKNFKLTEDKEDSPVRKRLKPTCLHDCPEWDFIRNSKSSNAPVLLNGNIAGTVRLDTHCINVTSTCAFDSIFQGVLNGLIAHKVYSDELRSSDCAIVKLAQSVISKRKIFREHYIQRAKILTDMTLFKKAITTYTKSVKRLDAESNAAHLAQYLLVKEPSYSSSVNCPCGYTNRREYTFISINIDTILCRGLQLMQDAINDCIATEVTCFNCKIRTPCFNEYGSHLLIDTSAISDPHYANKTNIVTPRLEYIKKILELGGKTYMITAVIDFNTELKHYVTYGLAGVFWHKYDGLQKKRASVSCRTPVFPHLILYALCNN